MAFSKKSISIYDWMYRKRPNKELGTRIDQNKGGKKEFLKMDVSNPTTLVDVLSIMLSSSVDSGISES